MIDTEDRSLSVRVFYARLKTMRGSVKSKDRPFFIRIEDREAEVDFAQTGWKLEIINELPTLITGSGCSEVPSNYQNMTTVGDLILDIEKISDEFIMEKSVRIDVEGKQVPLKVFFDGGILMGLGQENLDILGIPTFNESDILYKAREYYILESTNIVFSSKSWSFGESLNIGSLRLDQHGSSYLHFASPVY